MVENVLLRYRNIIWYIILHLSGSNNIGKFFSERLSSNLVTTIYYCMNAIDIQSKLELDNRSSKHISSVWKVLNFLAITF